MHISHQLTGHLDEHDLDGSLVHLSAGERARQSRLVQPADRRDFAAAHLLLRRALSARQPRAPVDWTFVDGRNGKPALAGRDEDAPSLLFNLAHTAGLVACVVAPHGIDVGIDAEPIDAGIDGPGLARDHFSQIEAAALEQYGDAERHVRFVELWTLKEAFVKATGDGLSAGMRDHVFLFDGGTSLRFETSPQHQGGRWTFALFGVGTYRLAVAARTSGRDLRIRDSGPAPRARPGGSACSGRLREHRSTLRDSGRSPSGRRSSFAGSGEPAAREVLTSRANQR